MKQKTPRLTLEPFDQDTFQRVWRRVMPDQDLSPIQPTVPAFSPDSPGTPETPTPPVSPCPPQTSPPACLCPDSESYAPCLEQLMEDTCALSRAYQNTARRCGGRTARLLSSLLPSLGQDHRRLCAAYFLITGERYTPVRSRSLAAAQSLFAGAAEGRQVVRLRRRHFGRPLPAGAVPGAGARRPVAGRAHPRTVGAVVTHLDYPSFPGVN